MNDAGVFFTVRGLPIAQGNARAFVRGGHAVLATSANNANSPLGAWRAAIRSEGQTAMGERAPLDGPLSLSATFTMPRPKSHFNAHGSLKDSAPDYHIGKPDIDKLLRAVLDGLTNVVVADDSRIAIADVSKGYGPITGCMIHVTAIEP